MSDDKGKYSKVEREILEILDGIETKQQPARPSNIVDFRRPARNRLPRFSMPKFAELRYAISPGKLLLLMLLAILGAVFLKGIPFASPILILVAILAFVGVFFARARPSIGGVGSKAPSVKRWRGRDIDLTRRR